MAYLLDSDVFIQAKNLHYGFDFCPAFWDWLLAANARGEVFSIGRVRDELVAGADSLADWAKARNPGFFVEPDAQTLPLLARVSQWTLTQNYEPAAINTFLQVADYYLVSQALARRYVVVTHEFREGLMAVWGSRCAMTWLAVPELLRASNAKPWADSNDSERFDVYNGLLLAAHWDAAIDVELIAVAPGGAVIPSHRLSGEALATLGWRDTLVVKLSAEHEPYLGWHRERVFQS